MPHVMLDLETLGNGSTATIISIGAVEFFPQRSAIGKKIEIIVDPDTCVAAGMKNDQSTIDWWAKQSPEARTVFTKPKVSIQEALQKFTEFLSGCGDKVCVWGNGATFDNVILSNAYLLTGIVRPWKYYNDMCFRTMKKLYPTVHQDPIGVSHNAVDDAEYQAHLLMKIFVQAGLRNV